MEMAHDVSASTPEYTDDLVTEISEVSTPASFSADASPQLSEQPLPLETPTPRQKKKKKKKFKKTKAEEADGGVGTSKTQADDSGFHPQVLCISRNKHWRYISSYHGPWLSLPLELLDSLFRLNLDSTMYPSPSSLNSSARHRLTNPEDFSPGTPRVVISASYPTTGKPLPPPIDPGVMSSILQIRRFVDEATDLAVRASSGLSAVDLGSVRNTASYNGTTWAAAQSLGLNPPGPNVGGGRNPGLSANRIHRLRCLAVQKLAQAYRMDEVAASVLIMQGGSVFDDVAERVLKHDPSNPDAKYVHFFHEKIPSSQRSLASSTPTTTLDELIFAYPHQLEYHRTRGIVRSFREEFSLAIKDFTYAIKEIRIRRRNNKNHGSDQRASKMKKRKGPSSGQSHTNGQAPSDGTAVPEGMTERSDGDLPSLHPSMQSDAPEPFEAQLFFFRGAAHLQQAIHIIEASVIEIEGIKKPADFDSPDLRLCCLTNGRYGGVEIGNPDGPLGSRHSAKLKVYRQVLAEATFRDQVHGLLKKSIRDYEKFLSHFDGGETAVPLPDGSIADQVEFAFTMSESMRPGHHSNPNRSDVSVVLATYHPLLIESHFSVLICYLMLGNFDQLLHQFVRTAALVDSVEGYPVFLSPRSIGQAEFVETLVRLAAGWRDGCQPHSLSGDHRGKARLVTAGIHEQLPTALTPSASTCSTASVSSMDLTASAVSIPTNSVTPLDPYYLTGPSSSKSPFIGSDVESSSSSGFLLHPDMGTTDSYAPSTSSTSLSRKSSRYTLCTPCAPSSPSCSSQPQGSNRGEKADGETDQELSRTDALDCIRILLAPVVKHQREQAEAAAAAADKAKEKGLKKQASMPISIPLHGPRVEIILAWLGAVHLPELDEA